jgi:hypothetical protein
MKSVVSSNFLEKNPHPLNNKDSSRLSMVFNLLQTQDYIKIHFATYTCHLLTAHGWEIPSHLESKPGSRHSKSLPPSKVDALYTTPGHKEGISGHTKLAADMGFSCQSLLGELLYAYVTTRPDIRYAITTMAKFAISPVKINYNRLKGIVKYLHNTLEWGIIYWQSKPVLSLPAVTLDLLSAVSSLPMVPQANNHLQLYGYDANNLHERRSTTGYAFLLAGGVVAYRSKAQTITATSSTEAEFIAAVSSGKVAKYLCAVLSQLGFPQTGPTPICKENELTIKIVNTNRPTERSRHINVQYFAIQDWKKAGHLFLTKIHGIVNPSLLR